MTPKEAIIRKELEKLTDTHYEPQRTEDIDSAMEVIKQVLTSPPTVDELCKALSDFTGQNVLYSEVTHEFYYIENTSGPINNEYFITETYGDGLWSLGVYLPPHLITMIGRFYEGLK